MKPLGRHNSEKDKGEDNHRMATLILQLPAELSAEEARPLIAAKLWEARRLTLGQAAEMAGMDKEEFMLFLGKQNIPVFNYPADLETEAQR